MKKLFESVTLTTGLAIFAMLFGAGNLIWPLKGGVIAGSQVNAGLLGFIIGGVLIPLLGLIAMALFNGDYNEFFERIGKIPGSIFILFCMFIIGPLFVMPRIVALTFELMKPFIGQFAGILPFGIFFGAITFLLSYKKDYILDLLGKFLSPIKLVTLFLVIAFGLYTAKEFIQTGITAQEAFFKNLGFGYNTLDLLGTIFFGYIVISILRKTLPSEIASDSKAITKIVMTSSLIGGTLIGIIYVGLAYIGAYHGHGLAQDMSAGEMFALSLNSFLGSYGSLFIAITVFAACLSTMIALASVVTEYLRKDVLNNKINYSAILLFVCALTVIVSQFELRKLEEISGPFIMLIYPVLITLTLCNIAYKLWGFKFIKIPVLISFLVSTYYYHADIVDLFKSKPNIEVVEDLGL